MTDINDRLIASFATRSNELFRRFVNGSLPAEYTLERLQWLLEGRNLGEVPHVIDLEAPSPFQQPGFQAVSSRGRGRFLWDAASVDLHVAEAQTRTQAREIGGAKMAVSTGATGREIIADLKGLRPLNANALSYLLERPKLIPDAWKGKNVFFWGTIYRCSTGECVLGLFWNPDARAWDRTGQGLDDVFFENGVAAIQAE